MMEAKARDLSVDQQAGGEQEWLSALFDDELEDEAAQRTMLALGRDPHARARWAEYSLIGDALRGELQVQPRLMDSLGRALEQEPTVLAPMPRSARGRPALWLAAAAAVGGITWTLWGTVPLREQPLPVATLQAVPAINPDQVMPYLVAHQDYAQAVVSNPELSFTRVSLSGAEGGR